MTTASESGQGQFGQLYGLLVGINTYPAPIPSLRGCVPDVEHIRDFLDNRVRAEKAHIEVLADADATRQRVIDTFRTHLGKANGGDVALFYFSGHGAQQTSPEAFWRVEPDRLDEILVCYDSYQPGSWGLADKEIGQLIAEVAKRGAHIIVVLDACHSGSGTRAIDDEVRVRRAPTDTRIRPLETYYGIETQLKAIRTGDETIGTNWLSPRVGRHIVISACRPEEVAKEMIFSGQPRGALSYYLLEALQQNNANLTYRDLFKQIKARVESRVSLQSPLIEATTSADLSMPFLGGAVVPGPAYFTVSRNRQGAWIVDGGAAHGLQQGREGERVLLALYPSASDPQSLDRLEQSIGTATVIQVGPGESVVTIELANRQAPDSDAQFKALVVALPLPPVTVAMHGDATALGLVRNALGGEWTSRPSLLVRESRAGEADGERALQLTAADGTYRIRRCGDIYPLSILTEGYTPASADLVVARLEHIARWLNILFLTNPTSQLSPSGVEMAIFPIDPMSGAEASEPLSATEFRFGYTRIDGEWVSPRIKLRLRNTTNRALHCCLLDLTESFGVVPELLPGGSVRLAPKGEVGDEVWANNNEPIDLYIPPDLQNEGVTSLRDVLKLIVSTDEVSGYWLQQSDLDVTTRSLDTASRAPVADASAAAPKEDTLTRLMHRVFQRALGQDPARAARRADWQCQELLVTVTLPPEAVPLPPSQAETVELAGGVTLTGHEGLKARARLVNQEMVTRSLGNLALPPLLRDHPQLAEPFALTTHRSIAPITNVLELFFEDADGSTYAAVTREQPLVLRVDTPLSGAEGVLPIAFDGEFFLPLGTYRRLPDGRTEIQLERLPYPTHEGSRSLGGAIKIMFQKLLSDKLAIKSEYPRLALPTVAHDGQVTYDANGETIRAKIAAAQRVLLYIHGIIGDTQAMVLSTNGMRAKDGAAESPIIGAHDVVLTFDYESINTKIERTAQDLKRKLKEIGLGPDHGKHLHIIAHSMGGLVTRWLIEKEGGNKVVQHLTMLGTPNGGSPWPTIQDWATTALGIGLNLTGSVAWPVTAVGWLVGAIETVDEALDEMKPDSGFLHGLASSDDPGVAYTILAGNTSIIDSVREQAGAAGVDALARLIERLAPQRMLHGVTAMAFLGQPNDIAVSVDSISAVPTDRVPKPSILPAIACDHLTYFSNEAALHILARTVRADG